MTTNDSIKKTILILLLFLTFSTINCQTYSKEAYALINQIIKANHITLLDIHSGCTNGLVSDDSIIFNPQDFQIFDSNERLYNSIPVIDTLLNSDNIEFFKNQINDCKRFKYWIKDSVPEFTQLYKLKKFIPLLPLRWNTKRHNPPNPLTSLSFPVFNSQMNIAFIEIGLYYGFNSGFSVLFIYKKQNNIWIEYAQHQLWAM